MTVIKTWCITLEYISSLTGIFTGRRQQYFSSVWAECLDTNCTSFGRLMNGRNALSSANRNAQKYSVACKNELLGNHFISGVSEFRSASPTGTITTRDLKPVLKSIRVCKQTSEPGPGRSVARTDEVWRHRIDDCGSAETASNPPGDDWRDVT